MHGHCTVGILWSRFSVDFLTQLPCLLPYCCRYCIFLLSTPFDTYLSFGARSIGLAVN